MTTDLVFGSAPLTTQPINLVFGETDAPPLVDVTVVFSASLPALAGAAGVALGIMAPLVAALPALTGSVAVAYNTDTHRPTVGRTLAEWQQAHAGEVGVQNSMQATLAQPQGEDIAWQPAVAAPAAVASAHTQALARWQGALAVFAGAMRLGTQPKAAAHQDGTRTVRPSRQLLHQNAVRVGTQVLRSPHQDAWRDRRAVRTALWQVALRNRALGLRDTAGKARAFEFDRTSRYQQAVRPPAGRYAAPAQPPGPEVFFRDGNLLFECPPLVGLPLHLVFGAQACYSDLAPGAPLYILPARFYMTAHSIYAERLPDLAEVPVFDATVSADAGSYCWTLQANGPASLFELLAPVGGLPVQLRITMDGIPWVFAVDSLNRSSSFGKAGVSISGRSVTALIGAPYLRAVTRDNAGGSMLAQQLALSALQYTGVALDWGLTDWLVPAGAWSHQGTALDAVQAIAQAAGGYLQSHRSAATLLTRHPYSQRIGDNPGAPWGWMTGPVDVELAPDSIITDGTERHDGPDINAVYVSGTTQGVLAQVKRTGTAADKLASMVTDPLITHADAARQRGLAVLGAAGAKYNVRLELPVLTGANQPGVLDVGQLVQVNATIPWRGRVRAVSINAKRPSLRQTVTLERHLETV